MSSHRSGQVQTSRFYKYLNDVIIRPTQVLIAEESTYLSLENEELKKNNEDLSNRIEQMFQEFDFISGSNKRMNDSHRYLIRNSKKSKTDSVKVGKTFHSENSQTNKPKKNKKIQSRDTVDGGTLHDVLKKEKEAQLYIKSKEIENREINNDSMNSRQENLMKNVQYQNKMLQKEYEVPSKPLKEGQNENSMVPQPVDGASKQSYRSPSPIYIDIFDNPDQALKFKIKNEKHEVQRSNQNKNSLVADIYSEIPAIGTLVELPNETVSASHRKFLNPSNSTSIDTINSATQNLLDLSETQKAIINLISQNSDIIQGLQKEQSILSKSVQIRSLEHQVRSGTKKSETCQTYSANEKHSTCINQSVHCVNDSSQILRKIDEQNIKIENLSETLSMILNRTEDIKTTSTNNYNSESPSKLEQNSVLNKDLNHPKESDIAKYSQSLDFSVNNRYDNDTINDNYNIASIACSFSDPNDANFHLIPDKISYTNHNDENCNNQNENYQLNENKRIEKNVNSNAKKHTENINDLNTLLNDGDVVVKTEISSLSKNPPVPKSCKIPKRINYNSGQLQSKSHDKFEILCSNDLESSYETLYDPILSARSFVNDENITYL